MKSIKEKAKEYHRVIRVLNKHSTIVDTQCSEMFVKGGNYVLDILEKELPLEDNRNLNDYGKALVWRLKSVIKQLKK